MIRHSARLLMPRGRFSSMLELGGSSAPEAAAKRLDVGKNNKVRSILLDFDLITRSIEAQKAKAAAAEAAGAPPERSLRGTGTGESAFSAIGHPSAVRPDVGMVENIAGLLNVELGGQVGGRREDGDDLSRLTGEKMSPGGGDGGSGVGGSGRRSPPSERSAQTDGPPKGGDDKISAGILGVLKEKFRGDRKEKDAAAAAASMAPPPSDVRAKYAAKLRDRLDGVLAGVDRARSERDDVRSRGDAAGHLAARRAATANPPASGSRWLATTGAGNLLMYLTGRSMSVALLPLPGRDDGEECEAEGRRMEQLTRQLPQARFDLLVRGGRARSCDDILELVAKEVDVPPLGTLMVSDRDDYLRCAKERGMYTCRVRPKNAPRGNVTSSYSVATVGEVQDVVNELNGMSFNAVLGATGINHGGV